MAQQTDSRGTGGNHSELSSATRLQVIAVAPSGKTKIWNYQIDQQLDKPLKIFDTGPISEVVLDTLPKRYHETFEKGFSKRGLDTGKSKPSE